MFKFLGLLFISISIVIIINKNIILRYFTYIFIYEAITILENMKNGCIMGKTYSKVLSEMDYSGFNFFIYVIFICLYYHNNNSLYCLTKYTGLFFDSLKMRPMYSPMMPKQNNCIPPKNNETDINVGNPVTLSPYKIVLTTT